MRVTTGSTRAIQGVCQGVFSAKTFCMSTQIWAVRSVRGPKGSASNRFVGIRAVARMPVLAIRPPRTPAPRRPLDRAAASHDLQQSRRVFDQLQPNPGWVAERFKAPVLKFDGGRAVPSPFVPGRVRFQCFRGRSHPFSSRLISSRSGAFGSKLGSHPSRAVIGDGCVSASGTGRRFAARGRRSPLQSRLLPKAGLNFRASSRESDGTLNFLYHHMPSTSCTAIFNRTEPLLTAGNRLPQLFACSK
jgi:hypothetical protein